MDPLNVILIHRDVPKEMEQKVTFVFVCTVKTALPTEPAYVSYRYIVNHFEYIFSLSKVVFVILAQFCVKTDNQ